MLIMVVHLMLPGDDFNDDVHTFTLQDLEQSEIDVEINIVDDDISEHMEIFLLVLRVVNASEETEINIGRNVSVVRIRQDSKDGKSASYIKIFGTHELTGDITVSNDK